MRVKRYRIEYLDIKNEEIVIKTIEDYLQALIIRDEIIGHKDLELVSFDERGRD